MSDQDTPIDKAEETAEAPDYKFGVGDSIFIHANAGKFIAVVDERYPTQAAAEEAYDLSFQTITKYGPLYDYDAPHYLCHLANPGKQAVGACEADSELKARCED